MWRFICFPSISLQIMVKIIITLKCNYLARNRNEYIHNKQQKYQSLSHSLSYFQLDGCFIRLLSKRRINNETFGASTPLCYKQLGRGWVTSKHNCLVSYLLCWRRHVSANVGHLQVAKIYVEENYTEYDHSIGAYFNPTDNEISLKV